MEKKKSINRQRLEDKEQVIKYLQSDGKTPLPERIKFVKPFEIPKQ